MYSLRQLLQPPPLARKDSGLGLGPAAAWLCGRGALFPALTQAVWWFPFTEETGAHSSVAARPLCGVTHLEPLTGVLREPCRASLARVFAGKNRGPCPLWGSCSVHCGPELSGGRPADCSPALLGWRVAGLQGPDGFWRLLIHGPPTGAAVLLKESRVAKSNIARLCFSYG